MLNEVMRVLMKYNCWWLKKWCCMSAYNTKRQDIILAIFHSSTQTALLPQTYLMNVFRALIADEARKRSWFKKIKLLVCDALNLFDPNFAHVICNRFIDVGVRLPSSCFDRSLDRRAREETKQLSPIPVWKLLPTQRWDASSRCSFKIVPFYGICWLPAGCGRLGLAVTHSRWLVMRAKSKTLIEAYGRDALRHNRLKFRLAYTTRVWTWNYGIDAGFFMAATWPKKQTQMVLHCHLLLGLKTRHCAQLSSIRTSNTCLSRTDCRERSSCQ